jgi:hypothetical protein
MKNLQTYEEFLNEGQYFIFDEIGSDITNLQDKIGELLKKDISAPKWIVALKGIQSACKKVEDMIAKADEKLGVIPYNESSINEAMSLTDYYRNSDKEVKGIAKEIDGIIDMAGLNINKKNELLDLITDLTDAYLADMRNESVVNEGVWAVMMKGVKTGDNGPWSIVALEYAKVVGQSNDIKIKDLIPAKYEDMKRKYPKAKFHIEDGGGRVVWTSK